MRRLFLIVAENSGTCSQWGVTFSTEKGKAKVVKDVAAGEFPVSDYQVAQKIPGRRGKSPSGPTPGKAQAGFVGTLAGSSFYLKGLKN